MTPRSATKVGELIRSQLADKADRVDNECPPPGASSSARSAAIADLMSTFGVLPDRAVELVDGIERASHCFFAWALLLRARLDRVECRRFLERHGYFPKWSTEVEAMRR
jgi:hypothetical protein